MSKLNKASFSSILGLYKKQPWLSNKEDELLECLEYCPSFEHQEFLIDLLGRFQYVDNDQFQSHIESIADFIINRSGFQIENTQIIAPVFDSEPDSSQAMLQHLKAVMARKKWGSVEMANNMKKCISNNKLNQIIIIDEFVGSGSTMIKNINHIRVEFAKKPAGMQEVEIKCCFLAGMRWGLEAIEKTCGLDIYCSVALDKGISDSYDDQNVGRCIQYMQELEESRCGGLISDFPQYSLGYNRAEALFSGGYGGNTPNSVFPFFWWPVDVEKKAKNNVLTRYEKKLYEYFKI